jgi:hypothetical protein
VGFFLFSNKIVAFHFPFYFSLHPRFNFSFRRKLFDYGGLDFILCLENLVGIVLDKDKNQEGTFEEEGGKKWLISIASLNPD